MADAAGQAEVEFEDLGHGAPFLAHMAAGALAGVTEHCVMFPVDTIKTRRQVASASGPSPFSAPSTSGRHEGQAHGLCRTPAPTSAAMRSVGQGASVRPPVLVLPRKVGYLPHASLLGVINSQGWRGVLRLYKGVGAAAAGAGPAHAVYFSVYEAVKAGIVGEDGDEAPQPHPVGTIAASACATVISDGLMTPADVIKQRLQVCNSPYKGVVDCAVKLLRYEGPSAFYRSYSTTLLMNLPFAAVNFGVYDLCKSTVMATTDAPPVAVHLVSGAVAGGCAAAATTPMDVIKTRLQTEAVERKPMAVLRSLLRQGGARALFLGVGPRVWFHVPAVAICWATYEACKSLLL